MDINLIEDPNLIPKPREQIAIQSLKVIPLADGHRIRVEIQITPFSPQDRLNLQVVTRLADGSEVASMEVVATLQSSLRLTVHLQQPGSTDGSYIIEARLYFDPAEVQHSATTSFTLPDDITDSD